ncbi:MAG: tetratricopeptide repeat protein, partial [bacterium]
ASLVLDKSGPFAPGALYQEGECAYDLEHWTVASSCWRAFLDRFSSDPLAPAARYSLAWCLFKQGNFSDAATAFHEFSVIHADHPLAPWALYLAGVSLARGHNLDLAESAYRICLKLYPNCAVADRCAYGLAWLANMRKDYVAAADAWSRFLEVFPNSSLAPSAVFLLADAQYQQGRFAAAHDEYMVLLKRFPGQPLAQDALYYAANASLALGDWAKSSAEFHAFLKARPGSPFALDARLRLADCDYSKGDLDAASKAYMALRAKVPGTQQAAEALVGLAWVSFSRKDWGAASKRFQAAASVLPPAESGRAWLRAGDSLFNAERHAQAIDVYAKAEAAAYPRSIRAQAHFGAAWSCYRLKDFDRAAAEWARARALSPDPELQAESSYWIGWALFRQNRYAQAASVFAEVASRYRLSHLVPDALVQEGNALHNAGDDAKALLLYRKVADTWPQLPAAGDALHGLQISYTAMGRDDEAVAAERAFLKSHADSDVAPEVQYQIAEHYLNLKDWPQAEKELDLLKTEFPNSKVDLVATYWRAEARFRQMKFDKAIQDWTDLVRRAPQNPLAPRAAFRVGLAWYRQQEYPQAEDAFRRVLDAYGNTRDVAADARFNLALTYKRMGRDPDAVAAYQAVAHDYPDSALADMARIRIGYIYEDSGQYAKALVAYRDLASRNKGKLGAEAQYLVGDVLLDLKQNGEALLAYDAVAKNFAGQGAWAVTALARGAEILESEGRTREALKRYETIAKTSTDPAWAAAAHQRAILLRKRLGLPPEGARKKTAPHRRHHRLRSTRLRAHRAQPVAAAQAAPGGARP